MDMLQRLIGHDVPYEWQLVHEIMVDDNFRFSIDGLIVSDPEARCLIDMAVRAVDSGHQDELTLAISQLLEQEEGEEGEEGKEGEISRNAVDRSVQTLKNVMSSLIDNEEQMDYECLDSKLMIQMLLHNAFGKEQLCNILDHVVKVSTRECFLSSPSILAWRDEKVKDVKNTEADRMAYVASEAIHSLIRELRKLRSIDMNVRLFLYRPRLREVGVELEQKQIAFAIENGTMSVERTTVWFRAANSRIDTTNASTYEAMVLTHREGIMRIIECFAMQNKKHIPVDILPETLVLDLGRVNAIRREVRMLTLSVSLWVIAVEILKKQGVKLSDEAGENLQRDIFDVLGDDSGPDEFWDQVSMLLNIHTKMPNSSADTLKTCMNRNDGALREVFTHRICKYLTQRDEPDDVRSLRTIIDMVRELRETTVKLLTHLELVYGSLYVAILEP
jgi:hypothetical protein